jgi:hypothetical protein
MNQAPYLNVSALQAQDLEELVQAVTAPQQQPQQSSNQETLWTDVPVQQPRWTMNLLEQRSAVANRGRSTGKVSAKQRDARKPKKPAKTRQSNENEVDEMPLPQYFSEEANDNQATVAQTVTQSKISFAECSELLAAARESFDAIANLHNSNGSLKERFRFRMLRSFLLLKLKAYISKVSGDTHVSFAEVADYAVELMQRYGFPGI